MTKEEALTNPQWAHHYAKYVIKGRWVEAEHVIATDPEWAYYYARYVIKDRWSECEDVLIGTRWAKEYIDECIHDPKVKTLLSLKML